MKATVQNFRGISEACIAISPIALITGKNGAGKTSIARAIAAAVTGRAVPYDKVTKKDCAVMLRAGTRMGKVAVSTDTGSTTIEWPKADPQSDGKPPYSSPIAAGLTDIFSMKDKEALTYLINLLRADIRKDDFIAALEAKDIAKETAETIWATVDAQGWEAALLRAKDKGTKLKGLWENTTGEKYGSKKVAEWFPAEWDDSIAQETPESLQAVVDSARQTLEDAIGKNAVGNAERDSLKLKAESIGTLETQKSDAQISVTALETKLKTVEDELKANPSPDAKGEHACPHCEGKIHIKAVSGTQYILSKAKKVSESDLKEARTKNAQLCGEQQNASLKLAEAKRKLQSIEFDISNAIKAKQQLEKLVDAPEALTADEVQARRDEVQNAERRKQIFEQHRDASKTATMILDNQVIVELLDEKGLRRTKLAECLFSFQSSYTDHICHDFGIELLTLDADLNAVLGKTSYPMLSASEQFRVRTVLQLAIAQIENASLVIIDGADILDQGARGKLLPAVRNIGIPTIICMTLNKPDMAPNLAAAGAGFTYWVEGNTCKPVEIANASAKPKVAVRAAQEEQSITPADTAKGFMRTLQEKRDGAAA